MLMMCPCIQTSNLQKLDWYISTKHIYVPGHQKQVSRQTKPRKLSYSADDLDKSGIGDIKVEQILIKSPESPLTSKNLFVVF